MPCSQNLVVFAGMPLVRADVADTAVQMLDVVPVHELAGPVSGLVQILESTSDILGSVLGGSEGRFCKGVVVTHPWPGVRGFDPQPVEHRQHGGRFERGAVIAMQDGLGLIGCDALSKRCSMHNTRSMIGIVRFMHLPAHDLAAVDIENQVQKNQRPAMSVGKYVISQHQSSPGPFATWVVAGRCCLGSLARPRWAF